MRLYQKLMTVAILQVWVALATAFTAIGAIASPITFTMTTTATGALGDQGFTNALLTVTSFADTSLVTPPDSNPFQDYEVIAGVSRVNIAGIATATFADPIFWSDQDPSGDLVVLDSTSRLAILGFTNPVPGSALLTYNFQSSLGPQFGAFDFVVSLARSRNTFPTDAGLLSLTQASNDVFSATITPEPASFLIAAVGDFGIVRSPTPCSTDSEQVC